MDRRTFVLGLGTASAGVTALGTGAFTNVEAERGVRVELTEDANAYLGLESRSEYATGDSEGTLEIDFTSENPTSAGGEHFNLEATTVIDEVFAVQNLGAQDNVQLELDPVGTSDTELAIEFDSDSGTFIVVVHTWAFSFFPQSPEIIDEGEEVVYGVVAFHASEPILEDSDDPEEPNEFDFTLEISAETTNPGEPADSPPTFDNLDSTDAAVQTGIERTLANHHYAG